MPSKGLVTVFGATGAQGGSVARELLHDGWDVRAVTRHPGGERAKDLQSKGASICKADQNNEAEVAAALEGAHAVFAVTNFWDPADMHKEELQGCSMAHAAKAAGVQHYVWSTLPHVERLSGGKWTVPHFTDKAKVDEVVTGLGFKHTTLIQPGCFYTNMGRFFEVKKAEDGVVEFAMPFEPTDHYCGYDPADTGRVVAAVLNDPSKFEGKPLPLCGTDAPMSEYLEIFTKVTGRPARLRSIPLDQAIKDSEEFGHMCGWFHTHGYFGGADAMAGSRALGGLTTWEEWLRKTNFMQEQ